MPSFAKHGAAALGLAALLGLASCDGNSGDTTSSTTGTTTDTGAGGTAGAGGAATTTTTDTTPPASAYCDMAGLPAAAWSEGPYGARRHEIAADFTVELAGGDTWTFKDRWSGCESYVFLPDTIRVSDLDSTSIWEKDLFALLKTSPPNAHYFFVSRVNSDDAAKTATDAMKLRIDELLAVMDIAQAEHWRSRLHVVAKRSALLGGWLTEILAGIGRGGFAIDRAQRVRGIGNLADVKRFKQDLNDGGYWPWEQNLAYAAHEVRYFEMEVAREAKLAEVPAVVIPFWDGEILEEYEEKEIVLPTESEMAGYDTLEIDVTSLCPDPDKIEFGNCGAWDYLAYLFVKDDQGNNIELARFITSYHRETRWIVDVSPMLVHLKKGGARTFRWEFAPPWNTQPTATKLSLRLSNKNKGYSPSEATFLFQGGAFNSMYNALNVPVEVPIPADAKKVELFAIITGHGAETGQCAEFCNHQHAFKVNGIEYKKQHPEAGTQAKCIDQIENGMVPNQGGTWWFGRGGWCPGQQVEPWIIDVTADVTPGQTATVEYAGLYKNLTPLDMSGNIVLVSYLVISK